MRSVCFNSFNYYCSSSSCLFLWQQLCTPQNVNCRDLEGRHSTPLHFAAGYNRVAVVEYLLHHGADVHAKDKGSVLLLQSDPEMSYMFITFHKYKSSHSPPAWRVKHIFAPPAVWFLSTTRAPTVTTRWLSCWSDTELRWTWPTCGSSRRCTRLQPRANMRSANCCSKWGSVITHICVLC